MLHKHESEFAIPLCSGIQCLHTAEGDLADSEGIQYDDASAPDLVQCPPHTTEKRLVYKIDLHVIPFLCIMYLLAVLDR
jgi:hypothetical protein